MSKQTYLRMVEADNAFHAECVRQFGRNAGDRRYETASHDDRTRAARDAFLAAVQAHTQAQLEDATPVCWMQAKGWPV